jgi:hypothetical protein
VLGGALVATSLAVLIKKGEEMLKYKLTLLFFISIIFFHGCKNGPVEVDNKTPGLYAKIVDSNNNPVTDVNFHYIFYVGSNIVSRNMLFFYSLQSADTITFKIFDSFNNQIAIPIDNQYQPAGNHSYNYDASNLTNGIYSCSITGSTIDQKTKLFVLTDDVNQLIQLNPFKKSDLSGNIQISYSALGLGNHFLYQVGNDTLDLIIADSIKIVLFKEGYKTFVQSINIDTIKAFEKTFHLENN